jgi:hypothetical protein
MRRALQERGLTAASVVPETRNLREEEASVLPARLVEGNRLEAIPVELGGPGFDQVAFLDGMQRSEIVAYSGTSPIVVAEVAAAVRERRQRRLRTVVEERRRIALGRPAALEAAGAVLSGLQLVPLPVDGPPHPTRDLARAAERLDRYRGALEISAGDRYRSQSDGWLVVDGSLSDSPRWAADQRMVGVCRSHSVLPFDGQDLERYLRLPASHRSSMYESRSRAFAPVRAWALRLVPWEGWDLLHGLVRVEVAPANGTPEWADRISEWLLAERVPVSAPDRQWDRLLYGIHSVEQFLRARL